MEAAALVGKIAFSAVLSSVLLTSCSVADSLSSVNTSELTEPVGRNDINPYPYNIYKGVLLEAADFDTVRVKITEIVRDSEHHADVGDIIGFEYYDKIDDRPRRVSKYLVDKVLVKDAEVELAFTVADAEYDKDDEGNLFIRHAKRESGWQIIADSQSGETPSQYLDDNGDEIYITKEEFDELKKQS